MNESCIISNEFPKNNKYETDVKKIKQEHTVAEIIFANRNSHPRAPSYPVQHVLSLCL